MPGRVQPGARAHEHLVHLIGGEAGGVERTLDGDGAQFRGGNGGQGAEKDPIGVRRAEAMTTVLLISDKFVTRR